MDAGVLEFREEFHTLWYGRQNYWTQVLKRVNHIVFIYQNQPRPFFLSSWEFIYKIEMIKIRSVHVSDKHEMGEGNFMV